MSLYKIPVRFARFENGEYVNYPPGSTVDLTPAEYARFATDPEPVNDVVSVSPEPVEIPVVTSSPISRAVTAKLPKGGSVSFDDDNDSHGH